MDFQEDDDEHGDDEQGMQAAQFARFIQPGDQLGHRRGVSKGVAVSNTMPIILPSASKAPTSVAKGLVFAAMPFVLLAVARAGRGEAA